MDSPLRILYGHNVIFVGSSKKLCRYRILKGESPKRLEYAVLPSIYSTAVLSTLSVGHHWVTPRVIPAMSVHGWHCRVDSLKF